MTELLYDLLISVPMTVFFTGVYSLYFLSDVNRTVAYILSVAFSLFVTSFFKIKTKWKIVSGSAFIGVIGIFGLLMRTGDVSIELSDYLWCAVVFAIAIITCALTRIFTKYVRLKGIFSILVLAYLIFSMVTRRNLCKVDMIASGIIILTALSELIQKYWKKEGYTDRKTHTLTIAPFFLEMFLIIAFVKAPDKPYDWQFFINVGKTVKQGYIVVTQKVFGKDEEGYISVYGIFNDDGELHPDVSQSKSRVLALKPYYYAPSRLYLAGIVSDNFDGRRWTAKNNGDDINFEADVAESMYSAKMYGGSYAGDYLRTDGASMRLTYFNTQLAFLPSKTLEFAPLDSKTSFKKKEGTYRFNEMQGYGTEYDFKYAMFNLGNPAFEEYVNAEHPESEESFNEFTSKSYFESVKGVQYDDLLKYREYVYDVYLPKTEISEEARNLLDEITKDADTDYDKCKAIEEYLHEYEYTWHPGEFPSESLSPESFLDYFLFENKQGYCAYYATAFVLMARAEGIPTRYVQGYCVPTNRTKEVEVKGSMAHAWPEAYIKGVGWIQFEPTSGGNGTGAGVSASSWATQDEINEEYEKRAQMYYEMYAQGDMYEDGQPNTDEIDTKVEEPKAKIKAVFLLIPVMMAIAAFILFTIIERSVTGQKYKKASQKEKIRIICKKNLQLLKVLGYKIMPDETLGEYRKRLIKDLPSEMLGFIMIYEKLLYSDDVFSDADETKAHENYEEIFALIKEKRGHFIYLLQRSLTNVR